MSNLHLDSGTNMTDLMANDNGARPRHGLQIAVIKHSSEKQIAGICPRSRRRIVFLSNVSAEWSGKQHKGVPLHWKVKLPFEPKGDIQFLDMLTNLINGAAPKEVDGIGDPAENHNHHVYVHRNAVYGPLSMTSVARTVCEWAAALTSINE